MRRTIRSETGTLGVRAQRIERWASERSTDEVEVAGMAVRVKVSPGRAKAESRDAAKVAARTGTATSRGRLDRRVLVAYRADSSSDRSGLFRRVSPKRPCLPKTRTLCRRRSVCDGQGVNRSEGAPDKGAPSLWLCWKGIDSFISPGGTDSGPEHNG